VSEPGWASRVLVRMRTLLACKHCGLPSRVRSRAAKVRRSRRVPPEKPDRSRALSSEAGAMQCSALEQCPRQPATGGRPGTRGAGAMFYGAQVWDPVLIVAQIVTLQCLFYLSLGALLFVFVGVPLARPRRQRPGQLDRQLEPGRTACCTLSRGGALFRLLATHVSAKHCGSLCCCLQPLSLAGPARACAACSVTVGSAPSTGLARCGGLGERCACGGQGPFCGAAPAPGVGCGSA